ncbi:MAG TPA: dihydrofolate reductase family protein [Acidobacteriaceae bacterium]|nr:dihydrofolate reductase family protein [Acidobacteriaceae bacterium]
MGKVRVCCFAVSVDGFGAGVNQSAENPMGERGMGLHQWVFATRFFSEMHGGEGGEESVDNDFAVRGFENVGAWILGRNMFGPVRGPWGDANWRGWWGENPPYHVPVFVLTHYARPPLEMDGGTTFHFVTGGIEEALERAREAAGGKDIRIGGGVQTIRQYLQMRLIDEMHLVEVPALLGRGEALLEGLDLPALGYRVTSHTATEQVTHVEIAKSAS